jgi:hypothetical protein
MSIDLYSFVFRGQLTEQALDDAGRMHPNLHLFTEHDIAEDVGLAYIDPLYVEEMRPMAVAHTAIAAFENSVREFVKGVLAEAVCEDWWNLAVAERIRRKAETRKEDEDKNRWHGSRGTHPIEFTDMNELGSIMRSNFTHFEPFCLNEEWISSIFRVAERSRNVIMHSGVLGKGDLQRLGINIRDWIKQASA